MYLNSIINIVSLDQNNFIVVCTQSIRTNIRYTKYIAGIGNIYADESLFGAKIHPQRLVASITEQEFNQETGITKWILKDQFNLRHNYYPYNDLTFNNDYNKLNQEDEIKLKKELKKWSIGEISLVDLKRTVKCY